MKISDNFHISAQNIDCEYSLEPPRRGGSNEYPQSMFLSRDTKNNVYPCKPQFYYIKVGFKGSKLYRYVFVMRPINDVGWGTFSVCFVSGRFGPDGLSHFFFHFSNRWHSFHERVCVTPLLHEKAEFLKTSDWSNFVYITFHLNCLFLLCEDDRENKIMNANIQFFFNLMVTITLCDVESQCMLHLPKIFGRINQCTDSTGGSSISECILGKWSWTGT